MNAHKPKKQHDVSSSGSNHTFEEQALSHQKWRCVYLKRKILAETQVLASKISCLTD